LVETVDLDFDEQVRALRLVVAVAQAAVAAMVAVVAVAVRSAVDQQQINT
jgi:hypothetical protein